jgi:acetate kinase
VQENGWPEAVMAALAAVPVRPDAIVHRVVHGGEVAQDVVSIDGAEYDRLRGLTSLAPLHNTTALQAIEATRDLGVPLLAAFDSAFHRTLPELAHRYAIPPTPGVRRYGFHGWSHRYVTERYAELSEECLSYHHHASFGEWMFRCSHPSGQRS